MSNLTPEALNDIQGIILSGYGHLNYARFLFLHIQDAKKGKEWLKKIIPQTTRAKLWERGPDGKKAKPGTALNIAISFPGLKALGLPQETLDSFSTEFVEGIVARASILGDTLESAPEKWEVGGPNNEEVHILLMLYAWDEDSLNKLDEEHHMLLLEADGGIVEVAAEGGHRSENQREHFGFSADGLSQPNIEGTVGNPAPGQWVVKTGEFILGYMNEFDVFPPSPAVSAVHDIDNMLPHFPEIAAPNCRDFGRNGTYIVYRKLVQNVALFWQFIEGNVQTTDSSPDQREKQFEMIRLASKFLGRWPSGAPLVLTPDRDDPQLNGNNTFTYRPTDQAGYACPIGAHIRRSNPRDSLRRVNDTPEESFKTANQHRITRRGMPYGKPLFPPEDIENGHAPMGIRDDGQPRGLHFFAINADIKRQFEFVQQTWINNSKFNDLDDNKDPFVGDNDGSGHMTFQRKPVRKRINNLPRFVTTRGGAYFFMPSITALRFLSRETPNIP